MRPKELLLNFISKLEKEIVEMIVRDVGNFAKSATTDLQPKVSFDDTAQDQADEYRDNLIQLASISRIRKALQNSVPVSPEDKPELANVILRFTNQEIEIEVTDNVE